MGCQESKVPTKSSDIKACLEECQQAVDSVFERFHLEMNQFRNRSNSGTEYFDS